VGVAGTADAAPNAVGVSKEFQFEKAMGTIEDYEPFEQALKKRDGILAVSGSERSVTVKWDPAKLDEAKVRAILVDLGHAAR
jgi:allophanate hydrolase subunit 1